MKLTKSAWLLSWLSLPRDRDVGLCPQPLYLSSLLSFSTFEGKTCIDIACWTEPASFLRYEWFSLRIWSALFGTGETESWSTRENSPEGSVSTELFCIKSISYLPPACVLALIADIVELRWATTPPVVLSYESALRWLIIFSWLVWFPLALSVLFVNLPAASWTIACLFFTPCVYPLLPSIASVVN